MKTAFIHDHYFFCEKDMYYSMGGLPSTVWERYLAWADSIEVIGRKRRSAPKNMVVSSREGVSFNLMDDFNTSKDYILKRRKIKIKIREVLNRCHSAVIRLPSEFGYIAVELCRKMNIPYLLEAVGCPHDSLWNYGSATAKLWSFISVRNMKRSLKYSPFAIYVAEYLYKRYPTSTGKHVVVSDVQIPGDIESEILTHRLSKIDSGSGKLKLGLIGSIDVKYKGHDVLMRALAHLGKDKNIELYFAGGGEGEWIKKLAEDLDVGDKYHFLYMLKPGEGIFKFLDDIDIYVHPSKTEGLPRSVIEAMYRACPILSSNVGGLPELIETDFMHNPGDYKELARQIQFVASNKELLKKMAARNFESSKKYTKPILDNRRDSLFKEFAKYAENCNPHNKIEVKKIK